MCLFDALIVCLCVIIFANNIMRCSYIDVVGECTEKYIVKIQNILLKSIDVLPSRVV